MPSPLGRTIAVTFGRNLLVLLAMGVTLLFGVLSQEKVSYSRPMPSGSAEALVAEHGCWTGAAPAGVIAHHVVVTVDGLTRYAGQRLTDRAIEQAVFGVDHGLVVHGFCR